MELREPGAATAGTGAEAGDGEAQPPALEARLDWRELGRRVALMRSAPLLRGMSWELLATLAPMLLRQPLGGRRFGQCCCARRARAAAAVTHPARCRSGPYHERAPASGNE